MRFKGYINSLSKTKKVSILVGLLVLGCFLLVNIPSLARLNNRNTVLLGEYWNGSVSSSYRDGKGTALDPYIISNGSELAYFSKMSKKKDYSDVYFELGADILLNEGVFSYVDGNITYKLDNTLYYVNSLTGEYYNNSEFTGEVLGRVNLFSSIEDFSGNFDGNSYSLYGLFVTGKKEVGLFTNLSGYVSDLYVTNSFVYGGSVTGGIASSINGGTVDNVIYDGNVVSDKNNSFDLEVIDDTSIDVSKSTFTIIKPKNTGFSGRVYKSSLEFKYNVVDGVDILVNGSLASDGVVFIEDVSLMNEVVVSVIGSTDVVIEITDISYKVYSDDSIIGGLVGLNKKGTYINSINKSSVYGISYASGLIGSTVGSVDMVNSYNTGNINGYYGAGLISNINNVVNNINISNSYNSGLVTGNMSAGLVSLIANTSGEVNLVRVLDISTSNYSVDTISNSNTNFISVYYVNGLGVKNDDAVNLLLNTTMGEVFDKSFMTEELLFYEYIDFDGVATDENVWIYNGESMPILYIDDIANPIAYIKAGSFNWNNYTDMVNEVVTSSAFKFKIDSSDVTRPISEIYYYIGDNKVKPIESIDSLFVPYTGEVLIEEAGSYIVYAKVVDYSGNVYYMNSDILKLDFSNMDSSISVGVDSWNKLKDSSVYKYYDEVLNVRIRANDQLSLDDSVVYYISDKMISSEELDKLSDSDWVKYENNIIIDKLGTYVIYARVIDSSGNMRYINTDFLVYDGYTEKVSLGRDSNYVGSSNNISSNSIVKVNLSYNSVGDEIKDVTHNFVSTMLFPKNTVITMIDNVTNKVYKYEISTDVDLYDYGTSCDGYGATCISYASYPLTLFREVGTSVMVKPYEEVSYYDKGSYLENFTFVIDFSNADIKSDYSNVEFSMNLVDSSNKVIRPTLNSGIAAINLYSGDNSVDLGITSNYTGDEILLNSESTTNILLNTNILYKNNILDTSYENMNVGIAIRLLDSSGNVVDTDLYKSMKFSINGVSFVSGNDNIFRYNLGKLFTGVSSNLHIETSGLSNKLDDGKYMIEISNYYGNDGYFYDKVSSNKIHVLARVSNNYTNNDYSFDVIDDNDKVINKSDVDSVTFSYDILQKLELGSPSVRVSLYKKDDGNSFDQNYSLVDLDTYVTSHLNKVLDNTYLVSDKLFVYDNTVDTYNKFVMDFDVSIMSSGGYKLVFELYDGVKKVGTINRYFVVR